jgi:hypothetical protein
MEYTLESLEVYQLAEVFSDKIWTVASKATTQTEKIIIQLT